MDELQAAIYSYFHDGELPPDPPAPTQRGEWQPDPPKQWWATPENRSPKKITDEVQVTPNNGK